MTRIGKLWQRVLDGQRSLKFREFEALLTAFGFTKARIAGSHHIYVHRDVDRPISIQPRGDEAKPYQVRQFLDMIEEFGLRMEGRE